MPAIAWHTAARKATDRKSTRLNSSHSQISYAVFCLKKKKNQDEVRVERPQPVLAARRCETTPPPKRPVTLPCLVIHCDPTDTLTPADWLPPVSRSFPAGSSPVGCASKMSFTIACRPYWAVVSLSG